MWIRSWVILLVLATGCSDAPMAKRSADPKGFVDDAEPNGPSTPTSPIADGMNPSPVGGPVASAADAGREDGDADCGAFRAESQFERPPIDVIWAIDNSLSMLPQFLNVAAGLADFVAAVEASGADIRVVMVSTFVTTLGPEVQDDTERYLLRPVDVQSTNSFDVLLFDFPNYAPFLRPNAATHVIVVTDFVNTLPRAAFRDELEKNLGHGFTFHAIAEPLTGADYYALADETGGVKQPIASDWNVVFEQLQSVVVKTAELPCEVPLTVRAGADLENVQVRYLAEAATDAQQLPKAQDEDQCGMAEAWHFDNLESPTAVQLCPGACEGVRERGGSLDIVVGCEPPPPVL